MKNKEKNKVSVTVKSVEDCCVCGATEIHRIEWLRAAFSIPVIEEINLPACQRCQFDIIEVQNPVKQKNALKRFGKIRYSSILGEEIIIEFVA